MDGADLLRAHLHDSPDSARLLLLSRQAMTFVPISLALAHRSQALRAADLRLDDDEARALVLAHHPDVDAGDLERVVDQGAGWAAALVLAAHTLRTHAVEDSGRSDTRLALTAVTGSALDYLTNEVFAGYTPGLQQVLLATCQQTEVTSDDAIVMSGLPSAGDLLEQAAEDGLVVTRIRGSTPPRPGATTRCWWSCCGGVLHPRDRTGRSSPRPTSEQPGTTAGMVMLPPPCTTPA